jgi:hypothetical protein
MFKNHNLPENRDSCSIREYIPRYIHLKIAERKKHQISEDIPVTLPRLPETHLPLASRRLGG